MVFVLAMRARIELAAALAALFAFEYPVIRTHVETLDFCSPQGQFKRFCILERYV